MKRKQPNPRQTGANEPYNWPVTYRWVALGTLVMYTAIGRSTIGTLSAQSATATPTEAANTQSTLVVRRFDIAAGPLGDVLTRFESAADLQFAMAHEGIRNVASPGVVGMYTVEQALRALLTGTGVEYRFTASHKIMLQLRGVTSSVEVSDTVSAIQTSLSKYQGDIRDTPQTISVVPRQVLDQQNATTLRDALRNVAGISLAAGEGGAQGDNLTIRGFGARNDLFIDGMRDFGSYYRDPFNTQELEVLQGPSSVTFGRGSTGGVVNQATKAASLGRFLAGEADFGTDATRRVAIDANTPVPQLGTGAAFRLNGVGHISNVAGRDVAANRRYGIAPSLSLGLGTSTRWTFSYLHQNADDTPDYGIPWLLNGPAPVNRNNYYGFEDGNFLRTRADIGTVRFEHDFNSHWTLRNQLRDASYSRDVRVSEGRLLGTITAAIPVSSIQVNRGQIVAKSDETFLDNQLDLIGRFDTGRIHHTFVTGAEAARETSDPTRATYANVPTTGLLRPDPSTPFAGTPTITSVVKTLTHSASAYALDTVRLGQKWELTGGIRWDRFGAQYGQSVAPASSFSRVDQQPTWRSAIVYKPVTTGSFYFAAGNSFNPSAEALSLSASNANLSPEKNRTYEVGSKWDLLAGKLSIRGAWFRTEKVNARETSPTNSLLVVLAGNQRVDGTQIEVRGRIMSRWEMLSGYAYIDSQVISSQFYPASVGARLANVPRHSFTMWNNYRLPWRTQFGLGGNFVSSRTASSTVPLDPATGLLKQVPGYWVFNASLDRPLTEHIRLQANIYNLANRYYYDQLHPAHIVPGAGRSALIGIRYRF